MLTLLYNSTVLLNTVLLFIYYLFYNGIIGHTEERNPFIKFGVTNIFHYNKNKSQLTRMFERIELLNKEHV